MSSILVVEDDAAVRGLILRKRPSAMKPDEEGQLLQLAESTLPVGRPTQR